jgi:hypothetical protein
VEDNEETASASTSASASDSTSPSASAGTSASASASASASTSSSTSTSASANVYFIRSSVFEPLNLRFGQVCAGGVLVEVGRGSLHNEGDDSPFALEAQCFPHVGLIAVAFLLIKVVSIHRNIRRWGVGSFIFEPLYSPPGLAFRSCTQCQR